MSAAIIPLHHQPAGVRYYYWQLAPRLQPGYAAVAEALDRHENEEFLVDKHLNLSSADYLCIMQAVELDFPTFWANEWSEYSIGDKSHSVRVHYPEFDTLQRRTATIAAARQFISDIPASASPLHQFMAVYDKLCARVKYDAANPAAYHVSGALLEYRAVCSGIAAAFKLCCNLLGLPAMSVNGYAWPSAARTESERFCAKNLHCWNIVQLNGRHYHVDVTFDLSPAPRSYFLRSDKKMLSQRGYARLGAATPFLPACPADYFSGARIIQKVLSHVPPLASAR